MTDRELQQLLPDYLAGRLDPDISRTIKERCEQSPEMRQTLDEAKKYTDALAAVEPVRAPDDFLDKVHRRIEAPRGLFERLFKPLHFKLPIELAGVVLTVLVVILIYNPFSGKLPQQLVQQRAAEYEERQSAPPAPLTATVEEAAAEISVPKKDEVRAAAEPAQPKQSPRSTASPRARPATAQEVRKKAPPIPTAQPSAKISCEKPVIGRLAEELFTSEPTESASGFTDLGKSKKSEAPSPETESTPQSPMPARRANTASVQSTSSSDLRMSKQKTARGASSSGLGSPAADADASLEDAAPEMEAASAVRSERKMSGRNRSKEYTAEQPSATVAPLAESKLQQPEQPALLPEVEKMVRRYRGTVDSIILNNEDQVKIKISIPPKKLVELKKQLSDAFVNHFFSDFLSGSSDRKVIIIVEIHRK